MSELASMAAMKITNSINQHYQQLNEQPLTPPGNSTAPSFVASPSSESSIATNNMITVSSTTNTNPDDNSLDVTDTLSQQTISPSQTSTHISSRQGSIDGPLTTDDGSNADRSSTHSPSNSINMTANNSSSLTNANNLPNNTTSNSSKEDDYKSIGSVLEKLSLFEKLEQKQPGGSSSTYNSNNSSLTSSMGSLVTKSSGTNILENSKKNDEIYKSIRSIDKDPGMFFFS